MPDEAMIIRFRPIAVDRVLRSVQNEFARVGHHGLSCFADVRRDDEEDVDLYRRLLAVAELDGIDLARNRNFYVCAPAERITREGFVFLKDDDEGELPEHYCIDVGTPPTVDALEQLLGLFEAARTGEVLS